MTEKKIEELFQLEGMGERVAKEIESFGDGDKTGLLFEGEDHKYRIMIHTISQDMAGIPAAEVMADFFGLDISDAELSSVVTEELEFGTIKEHTNELVKELNAKVKVPGYSEDGTFYFDTLENSQDYGLMFWWEYTDEEIKERKEKINKLLNIQGHDHKFERRTIDVFGDVDILISIRQEFSDHSDLIDHLDYIGLDIKIKDFEDIDLEDEDAADEVREMFDDIVKEELRNESRYA